MYSRIDTEAYPKAGRPNPIVDLYIYDPVAKKTVKVDVRDGKPFDNAVVGHYVYRIAWSPDGTELLLNRTNRRQNILEVVAANPSTGACRVIIREEWPTGWIENSPGMTFLKDGKRFIWESERNGWKNFYLYDLSGKLINPITAHTAFEAGSLVKVDEDAKLVFYTARDGDNHLKMQLHRVGLDGKGDVRLTDPAFTHSVGSCMARGGGARGGPGGAGAGSCGISPDNKHFVDVYQTHNTPPATRLVDSAGKVVAELAASDLTKFNQLGLKKAERFTYKAADGKTTLYGMIRFPSNFDPSKKYPALATVYGGPASAATSETFVQPNALAEYGFLVLSLDSRAAPGMGKRTLDSIYLKLGQVEMDDMAEGVKALWSRPYFDKERVGIYGTSYGGYSSLMCVLRHPDVFRAGSASSAVTAWYHYDSIYTERYMWIPEENKEGYEAGNAMTYADKLNGRLLIYYGTADNNVHPTNSMQLIAALRKAGKSFEVQVGPGRRALGRLRRPDDGVLHREPGDRQAAGGASRAALTVTAACQLSALSWQLTADAGDAGLLHRGEPDASFVAVQDAVERPVVTGNGRIDEGAGGWPEDLPRFPRSRVQQRVTRRRGCRSRRRLSLSQRGFAPTRDTSSWAPVATSYTIIPAPRSEYATMRRPSGDHDQGRYRRSSGTGGVNSGFNGPVGHAASGSIT